MWILCKRLALTITRIGPGPNLCSANTDQSNRLQMCTGYIKNSQNSTSREKNSQKWAKDLDRHFAYENP
jgi:hypothetical protein